MANVKPILFILLYFTVSYSIWIYVIYAKSCVCQYKMYIFIFCVSLLTLNEVELIVILCKLLTPIVLGIFTVIFK